MALYYVLDQNVRMMVIAVEETTVDGINNLVGFLIQVMMNLAIVA